MILRETARRVLHTVARSVAGHPQDALQSCLSGATSETIPHVYDVLRALLAPYNEAPLEPAIFAGSRAWPQILKNHALRQRRRKGLGIYIDGSAL